MAATSVHALGTSYHTFDEDLPPLGVPKDYCRFHKDIKAEHFPKNVSKPVGILACQRDPYLRRLEDVTIMSVLKLAKERQPSKQSKKPKGPVQDPIADSSSDSQLWEVQTEDTVLFPEGGGQPNDTGSLVVAGITLPVVNVIRRGLLAIHVVAIPEDQSHASSMLVAGSKVDIHVDWERRWDHMTMHTAQHLLSALLDNHLNLPTLSWALPAHPSTEPCYVELSRGLSQDEIDQVEKMANALVSRDWGGREGAAAEMSLDDTADHSGGDVRVWIESRLQVSSNSASGLATPNGKETAEPVIQEMQGLGLGTNDQGEFGDRESRGLPTDYNGGIIRTAVIEGIDRSLCCGTHQPFLSKIQVMHILPTTASKISPKPTRLFMLAGNRAHRHLLLASRHLTNSALPLGCSRAETSERIVQREVQRREATRLEGRLKDALARAEGEAVSWKQVDGVWKALVERREESTHEYDFLQAVANHAVQSLQKGHPSPPYLLALVSSPDSIWLNKNHAVAGSFVQLTSSPPELAKQAGDNLKSGIDGLGVKGRVKGGGAKGKYMGKITGDWSRQEREAGFSWSG